MALKRKGRLPLSKTLFWRLGLTGLLLLNLILLVLVWLSGNWETDSAMQQGRRMLISLDTGEIQGKATADAPKPDITAQPAAPQEAIPASTEESAFADNGSLAGTEPVKPAAVPMAGINPALLEKASEGELPMIGVDGTKPWRYYAKEFTRSGNMPMIAIIVSGLGQSKLVTDAATKLPETITLSFSPYAQDTPVWVKTARVAGHEVMIDLPLQPANYPVSDPGPYGLLLDRNPEENEVHLRWLMSRFPGYVGFLTPQNEAFSTNPEAFKALLQSLGARGLMLAVGRDPSKSETRHVIESDTTASVIADLLLDEDLTPPAIQARLASLEQIARSRGYAIGVAQAFPLTIQQLDEWAVDLAAKGVMLVPVTFIARMRYS